MKTLYILGNGFDLHHGLNTQYWQFQAFLKEENPDLMEFLETYFIFQSNSDFFWNNFEEDLGTFDYEMFFSNHNEADPLDENFKPSDFFGVEDELDELSKKFIADLRDSFFKWIGEVELDCLAKLQFEEGAFFMNFNYTNLLQQVYHIPESQILHIHGDISSGTELVFGHHLTIPKEDELDENGDSNRTPMTDSKNASLIPLNNFFKPVEEIIEIHSDLFQSLTSIKRVFILGHSLNDIDLGYFIEVDKYAKNAFWYCTYYHYEDRKTFFRKLITMGVKRSKIKMIRIDDVCGLLAFC